MKNTNRLKLVPVLVIGFVLSAFSAMAEVKTIVVSGNKPTAEIKIKEGEVAKIISLAGRASSSNSRSADCYLSVKLQDTTVNLMQSSSAIFVGPATIMLTHSGGQHGGNKILSVDVTPNEKH